jgi:hypothetical protein
MITSRLFKIMKASNGSVLFCINHGWLGWIIVGTKNEKKKSVSSFVIGESF